MGQVEPSDVADRLQQFQRDLLRWFSEQRRALPWRDTDDAYAVLVSEIMLQQTQVSRVVPLFTAFIARWPDVHALAAASPGDVVGAWKGLGYNRRAVALHSAARAVVRDHAGVMPRELAQLQALPGVGPYTARAVRAFAYGLDDAPVDTNVARVLARAVAGRPLSGAGLRNTADAAVPAGRGRDWSAALMDLGASVCSARRPRCDQCPVRAACAWAQADEPDPAQKQPRTSETFVGSNRYHRGRLLDALRVAPVPAAAVATAAATDSPAHARQLAAALVADGLAQWDGADLRLPR
jgi:A/G-specific adenine glycosylase